MAPSISVCFPAYNEGETLRAVLDDARELLAASNVDYEVLICDDGSTDETPSIISDAVAADPRIRAWRHRENQGIFATFEDLYAQASKDFVFLNSTDGQWETRVLLDLIPLTASADIVIASRRDKHYRPLRRAVSWAFNTLPVLLFGVRTYDAGAVKLVRREILTKYRLVSRSPFAEAERLIRAARDGYRIIEHPVETRPRRTARGRGADWRLVRGAAVDLIRLWMTIRRGGPTA